MLADWIESYNDICRLHSRAHVIVSPLAVEQVHVDALGRPEVVCLIGLAGTDADTPRSIMI